MALQFDQKQAEIDKGLSQDQIANRANAAISFSPIPKIDTTQPVPVNNLNNAGLTQIQPQPEINPSSLVGGVTLNQDYFTKLYQDFSAQQQKQQEEQNSLMNTLKADYGKMAEEGVFQQQQEANLGVPEMYKNLNELNLQIADLSGAYDKEFARVETKGIQSGTPGVFYQGEQAAIQRQKAVEIGALSVRQAALTGNLQLAQQRAIQVTDLQFKPIENRIKQTLQFLDINRDNMSATEKRQADSLSLALQFQEQQLAQQKEIRNMALTSGVAQPYFMKVGDPTVYRTSDGYGFTSEQDFLSKGGKWDKIQTINPAESSQVRELMKDYGDAGILPSDSLAVATQKVKTQSGKYRKETKITGTSGVGIRAGGTVGSGNLQDLDILAEAVSNKLGSVAAKNSFINQYNTATTEEQKLKILASNVVLPTEIKNGIIQNTQVIASLDDVLDMLDNNVQTGLLQAGQSYIANKLGTGGDKQVEAIKSKLVTAIQPYRNKVTGAAWGTQEEQEYQALLGSVKFTPEDLRNKLEVFKQTLRDQSQQALVAGIDPLGAINQNSVIGNNQLFKSPESITPEQIVTTPETKGFWSKVGNFLYGKD